MELSLKEKLLSTDLIKRFPLDYSKLCFEYQKKLILKEKREKDNLINKKGETPFFGY